MELLKAIYQRRAVRAFSDAEIRPAVVQDLLRAAVQAPSALNQQPWAFVVVHGRARLRACSERAKEYLLTCSAPSFGVDPRIDEYLNAGTNLFHEADTLVLICAKRGWFLPSEDCYLAAQNFMLAAHAQGIGSCPIGCVRPWFNLPEIKAEFGLSDDMSVALPIVIGHAAHETRAVPRNEPEITTWIWDE